MAGDADSGVRAGRPSAVATKVEVEVAEDVGELTGSRGDAGHVTTPFDCHFDGSFDGSFAVASICRRRA